MSWTEPQDDVHAGRTRSAGRPPHERLVERRVSIEAGVTFGWRTYVGSRGRMVGIDRFGASAPGNVVMEEFGMTKAAVVTVTRTL